MSLKDIKSIGNNWPRIVKGIYRKGKIELMKPIQDLEEAELNVVIFPCGQNLTNFAKRFTKRGYSSEDEFKMIGLHHFFDKKNDADVDWEEVFDAKDR